MSNLNLAYNQELKKAMNWLSEQDRVLFLGQAVEFAGTGMYDSLVDVPGNKKMEFPVVENFQIGFSTGMAINGFIPVSVIPRWNFLLCAADQVVNHLDKMKLMSDGACCPKVLIRVAVGSEMPVDPQDQHRGNFSDAFRSMCKTIEVVELKTIDSIMTEYQRAFRRDDGVSTILVEFPDFGK
jgi:pyruvate/2-oxoglutarate/acetoin dehydrogenase E1 component